MKALLLTRPMRGLKINSRPAAAAAAVVVYSVAAPSASILRVLRYTFKIPRIRRALAAEARRCADQRELSIRAILSLLLFIKENRTRRGASPAPVSATGPHLRPTSENNRTLGRKDLFLLHLWACSRVCERVYALPRNEEASNFQVSWRRETPVTRSVHVTPRCWRNYPARESFFSQLMSPGIRPCGARL